MTKKALCIGINDYPGTQNDLSGCVNDAQDWAATLGGRGFEVQMLLDAQATKAKMVAGIRKLITTAQSGDSLVITYSGHGTFAPDTSGDEPDGYDEGLCPYDIDKGNVLLDDEIHALFKKRPGGVRLVLISDSCHSGSVTRAAAGDPDSEGARIRYLPPSAWLPEDKLPRGADGKVPTQVSRAPKASPWLGALFVAGGDLLMAGCQDREYSWDARFGGRANGAFTYYAHKTLKTLPASASYADWYAAIRNYLPGASYPQTPQIFGSKRARKFKLLS